MAKRSSSVEVEDFEEEVVETESTDEAAWRTLDELDIEEVDEDESGEDAPDVGELQSKIASLQAQVDSSRSTDEIREGFQQLGGVLKDLAKQKTGNAEVDQKNVQKLEDYETFKKRLGEGYYEAPIEAVEQFYQRKIQEEIGPAFNQVLGEVNRLKSQMGKQEAKSDEVGQIVLEEYGDEVDEVVGKGTSDVRQAIQIVAGRHMTDLIKRATAKALEEQKESTTVSGRNQSPGVRRNPPAESSKKVRVSSKDMADIKAEAMRFHLDVNDYVRSLKRKNDPRVSGKRR